jgi:hypothetical protein
MSCPATTTDFGEVVRCRLPAGHDGCHEGGCIGWSTPVPAPYSDHPPPGQRDLSGGWALAATLNDAVDRANAIAARSLAREETLRRLLRTLVDGSPHSQAYQAALTAASRAYADVCPKETP